MNPNNYEDIINLQHHTSIRHKRMSKEARAAQFAPFAALTGHSDAIKETERLTERKIELSEEEKLTLNTKLQILNDNIQTHPEITIIYFEIDKKKDGGKYITYKGILKHIDMVSLKLIFKDKTTINIRELMDIII